MTQSSSPQAADSITQLRSIKGVNTKTIMKDLCRRDNNIPPEVDDKNPNFIGMVLVESELTHTTNAAKRYESHIEQSIASIQAPLAALEQKRDARLLPSDLQEYAVLKAEVDQKSGQRKQIIQTINNYIDTKREKFAEITKKLTDRTPRTQKQVLPAELRTIEKQVVDLGTQTDKTNAAENTLQRRLYNLHKRISSAALAATGMKSPPLPRPGSGS